VPPRPLVVTGLAALVLGGLLELDIHRRTAWPTVLTWAMMLVGLALIALGARRAGVRGASIIWAVIAILVVGLVVLLRSG
jgi:lipopolysaccharide export LptBFGC system permease protein LptF